MGSLTTVYFVRHAHSEYSTDELGRPLSKKGLADAKRVAKRMEKESVNIVVSSPYKRAIQTVEGIAGYFQVEIEAIEELKERVLASGEVSDFNTAIEKVWTEETFAWDGGESNIIAQKRGVRALFHLLKQYENKNIVIGTHGNIMVLIMKYFSKEYDFYFWRNLQMPDIYKLTFEGQQLQAVQRIWEDHNG
ncbi:histidine phosphatase family protein [Niallia sp. Sow4_A1]|uniref:Histidine phosphatase family protein n=1 Tax=Niallia hominis TaxID=3133173 RepID=A0ABV1F490_9BACI|nr:MULTISPECIES: histidine phosphatase family protein [Bacillaceae]MCF2649462.1 histidine phosphatase family protein [Niallia circulans]MCM3363825.1 histidine phosphatase family protein [Niallia sp. MER TA 168]CAI9391794.1 2,3-bisphosphoglycerate-dependent phosphoglycerate mutase [Bacillus sp. T2.9-1]